MPTSTYLIQAISQDACELQADALEMLVQGRIRNAAEKAWGARHRRLGAGQYHLRRSQSDPPLMNPGI